MNVVEVADFFRADEGAVVVLVLGQFEVEAHGRAAARGPAAPGGRLLALRRCSFPEMWLPCLQGIVTLATIHSFDFFFLFLLFCLHGSALPG